MQPDAPPDFASGAATPTSRALGAVPAFALLWTRIHTDPQTPGIRAPPVGVCPKRFVFVMLSVKMAPEGHPQRV